MSLEKQLVIRLLVFWGSLILCALAIFWPYPKPKPQDTVIGGEAGGYLNQRASTNAQRASWERTYTSSSSFNTHPAYWFGDDVTRGIYIRDGQPRYSLNGREVTREAWRSAVSEAEWMQAQTWIQNVREAEGK